MIEQNSHLKGLLDCITDSTRVYSWGKSMNENLFYFCMKSIAGDKINVKYCDSQEEYRLEYVKDNQVVAEVDIPYDDCFVLQNFITNVHDFGRRNVNMSFEMSYPEIYNEVETWIEMIFNNRSLKEHNLVLTDFEKTEKFLIWKLKNSLKDEEYECCYYPEMKTEYLNSLNCIFTVKNEDGRTDYKKFIPAFSLNNYQALNSADNQKYEMKVMTSSETEKKLNDFFEKIMSYHLGFGNAMSYYLLNQKINLDENTADVIKPMKI
jgi:hypothetical protein